MTTQDPAIKDLVDEITASEDSQTLLNWLFDHADQADNLDKLYRKLTPYQSKLGSKLQFAHGKLSSTATIDDQHSCESISFLISCKSHIKPEPVLVLGPWHTKIQELIAKDLALCNTAISTIPLLIQSNRYPIATSAWRHYSKLWAADHQRLPPQNNNQWEAPLLPCQQLSGRWFTTYEIRVMYHRSSDTPSLLALTNPTHIKMQQLRYQLCDYIANEVASDISPTNVTITHPCHAHEITAYLLCQDRLREFLLSVLQQIVDTSDTAPQILSDTTYQDEQNTTAVTIKTDQNDHRWVLHLSGDQRAAIQNQLLPKAG